MPAGSVAVAAGQTTIYPSDTPGGWHLIGRTRVKPYDASRAEPFLFRPGDRVRFPSNRSGRIRAWPLDAVVDSDPPRNAHHRAGPWPLGTPGRWGSGGRPDGRLLAPKGEPARREPGRRGRARGHADRAGARIATARSSCAIAGAEFAITLDGRPVDAERRVRRARRRARAVRRAALRHARDPGGARRVRCAADAREPRDEPGQPHGSVRRPCARRRRRVADRRSGRGLPPVRLARRCRCRPAAPA